MLPQIPCPKLHAFAPLLAALALTGGALAQTVGRTFERCETPEFGGTYQYATGTFVPAVFGAQESLIPNPGVIYDNTCLTNYFSNLLNGSTVIDEGRIPTSNSPAPNTGTHNNYRVTGFQFAFCTRDLPGVVTVQVRFWENYDDCATLAAAGAPTASFTLTGLPGSTATGVLSCWTINVDLTGGGEFCMQGDADGVYDNGSDTLDGFGYGITITGQTGTTNPTTGGFFMAGNPSLCDPGNGTYYKNPGHGTGTGLDQGNFFRRDGMGGQPSGCLSFPGGLPYAGWHMRITADLNQCNLCPGNGLDTDLDTFPDVCDGCPIDPFKSEPGQCGCGFPDMDTDGDLVADCVDGCVLDPNKSAPGQCGCGNPDTDTDGDLVADCLDDCPTDPNKTSPGVCGCGVADVDTDGDTVLDCQDGCPTDPDKTSEGVCGCNVADADNDGDSFLDCVDNCPSINNSGQEDDDVDGVGNACDNCVLANPDQGDCDEDGIGDTCEISSGAPDCNDNTVPDACDIANATSVDGNSNSIPDECELGGTPFCFGTSGCPCGNNSAPVDQAGCLNVDGVGGKLVGSGHTSVSLDGLVLTATDLHGFIAVFFQGTNQTSVIFGDGIKCFAPPALRLGNKSVSGGTAVYPSGSNLPVSVKGAIPPAGGTRYYQVTYRGGFAPCGTFLNITNAVHVVWQP